MDAISKPSLINAVPDGFNPRARDGRDIIMRHQTEALKVSIHAPVMDAIIRNEEAILATYVSIHAPVMDAIYVSFV